MKQNTFQKYIKSAFFTVLALVFTGLQAQEEAKKPAFQFNGSVDAYYRSNLNGLNSSVPVVEAGEQTGTIPVAAPGTSFANDTGFALGMINFIGSYEGKKVGFVADLVFGPRGEDAVFGSVGSLGSCSS